MFRYKKVIFFINILFVIFGITVFGSIFNICYWLYLLFIQLPPLIYLYLFIEKNEDVYAKLKSEQLEKEKKKSKEKEARLKSIRAKEKAERQQELENDKIPFDKEEDD